MTDVLVNEQGAVAVVTLDRPERLNACRRETYQALHDAFAGLAAATPCRAIVLTGAGRAFCAGQDLDEVAAGPPPDLEGALRLLQDITRRMTEACKPIVAAINGPAVGFGVELTLSCDLRLASDAAWFMLPELKHGLFHTNGTYHLLPRIAGPSLAADMILTSRRIAAVEALQAGLVSRVVTAEQLLPAAIEAAGALAALDPTALALARQGLRASAALTLEAALEFETHGCRTLFGRQH